MYLIFSCNHPNKKIKVHTNIDTSEVIRMVFEKAFSDKLLKQYSGNYTNGFKDTFIFENDGGIILKHFPKFKKIKAKLVTKNQICEHLSAYNIDFNVEFFKVQVLQLNKLIKTDSSFEVTIVNTSAWPTIDSKGNRANLPEGIYEGNEKCDFSFFTNKSYYRLMTNNEKIELKLVDNCWGI
jgi:hypothetical protein